MSDRTPNIVTYTPVSLEDIAEMEGLIANDPGAEPVPAVLPYAVPLEDTPELEDLAGESSVMDPEELVFSLDHIGVATALSILSPRERQILTMKVGLDSSGMPHKSAEIAASLGLSEASVSSTLTRARNRLRAVPNIVDIINGEKAPEAASDMSQRRSIAA